MSLPFYFVSKINVYIGGIQQENWALLKYILKGSPPIT